MKGLPAFSDFLESMDIAKVGYDLDFFQRIQHYDEKSGPLSVKEKQEVAQIASSVLFAYLQAYQIWLCEELSKCEDQGR